MNREVARKVVIAGAVVVTILLLAFPPWVHTIKAGRLDMTRPGVHGPIYKTPNPVPIDLPDDLRGEGVDEYWSIQMDSRRLANELGIAWVIAGLIFYLLKPSVKTS